jgi:hypothetical protein
MNVEHYNASRGPLSPLVEHNGVACGFWLVGADYRNRSRLYGTYPPGYLKRMHLLFPDEFGRGQVLHLFSGSIESTKHETTLDIRPEAGADLAMDAAEVGDLMAAFDLVLADPPYEGQHVRYGTAPINRRKIVRACSGAVEPGGYLVWLDTVIPIWSKSDGWSLAGTIGLSQSTNHRVRCATILRRGP